MHVYILACVLSALIMYGICKLKFGVKLRILNIKLEIKYILILLASLPMLLIAGLRYNIGTDYEAYKVYFNVINGGQRTHIEYIYYLINKIVGNNGFSYEDVVFLCAFIFVFICFCVMYEESPIPFVSVLLFLGTNYYLASFNVMREMVGCAILLASIVFAYEKRFIPFVCLVLLAGGFHTSCLAFIVIYFIPRISITIIKTLLLISIIIISTPVINGAIKVIVLHSRYAVYFGTSWDSGSVGYINILLQFVILLFAAVFKDNNRKYQVYYNIQLVNSCLGVASSIPLVRRVQYIFGLPSIILLTLALNNIESKTNRIVIGTIMVITFFVYCVLVCQAGYNGVLPYQSILELR